MLKENNVHAQRTQSPCSNLLFYYNSQLGCNSDIILYETLITVNVHVSKLLIISTKGKNKKELNIGSDRSV